MIYKDSLIKVFTGINALGLILHCITAAQANANLPTHIEVIVKPLTQENSLADFKDFSPIVVSATSANTNPRRALIFVSANPSV